MARHINDAGLKLIKDFEGCRLRAYQDVAGIWTIGYGHIRNVKDGDLITETQAEGLLRTDLTGAETAVETSSRPSQTSDNQFAAMVVLCFNIGTGAFADSTVLRKHMLGAHHEAADAFLMWDKATVDGVKRPVAGLTRRRNAERSLYLTV
jgi:lysozyme